MNLLQGHLSFNRQPIITKVFNAAMNWQPDHNRLHTQPPYFVSCQQRFIKPQDKNTPQPYNDPQTNIVVAGDVYLTNNKDLCNKLRQPIHSADIELIASAYLKWSTDCVHHLAGYFMFVIWDNKKQTLFIATDRTGYRTCYYSYQDKKGITFSNDIQPLIKTCEHVTANSEIFKQFALTNSANNHNCYQEIQRLPAAHYLILTPKGISIKQYWKIQDCEKKLILKTRSDYYEAFRETLTESVKSCMQSKHNICGHISGGLDSSSIASIAAKQLLESGKTLHGFTSRPNQLNGNSYKANWQYHEMPLVQTILDQYPNIIHHQSFTRPTDDVFDMLSTHMQALDQPVRNIGNLIWILNCYQYTNQNNCRIILAGARGNSTISWKGQTLLDTLKLIDKKTLNTHKNNKSVKQRQASLLKIHKERTKKTSRQLLRALNLHKQAIDSTRTTARAASFRTIELYYGTQTLDPTYTLPMKTFCYNVPQWVFHRGSDTINRRLLVREGLKGIVPDPVLQNTQRGEQGADWYIQYNHNIAKWKQKLANLSPTAADIIWEIYNKQCVFELINRYPHIEQLNATNNVHVRQQLLRCLGNAFFCDAIVSNPKVSAA